MRGQTQHLNEGGRQITLCALPFDLIPGDSVWDHRDGHDLHLDLWGIPCKTCVLVAASWDGARFTIIEGSTAP